MHFLSQPISVCLFKKAINSIWTIDFVILFYVLFQVWDHLVFLFCIWDGINIMVFSCIKVTLVEIIVGGRQHALETTVW